MKHPYTGTAVCSAIVGVGAVVILGGAGKYAMTFWLLALHSCTVHRLLRPEAITVYSDILVEI